MKIMKSICPYPGCRAHLDLEAEQEVINKRGHWLATCPSCNLTATFREKEAIEKMEASFERRKEANIVEGGAEFQSPALMSVLCEDVRSLWNVGSIFRTADGAGFSSVYLSGISGSPPRKEIEKVSLGAEKTLGWKYKVNPLDFILDQKALGVQILGLERNENSTLLTDAIARNELRKPLCVVVGNEVSGLSPQVMHYCDLLCHLPMRGHKESLNVAVAFGIAAYLVSDSFH
ncbi:MAG: TrmH family RNA methyltransferase [Cyanobacteria bacterium TGS_CYA1]|nr:TrmH family RNA methyltransferase [Cyanobacteria bacterium TGS_CYA1]